jgi:hypothetical protein
MGTGTYSRSFGVPSARGISTMSCLTNAMAGRNDLKLTSEVLVCIQILAAVSP